MGTMHKYLRKGLEEATQYAKGKYILRTKEIKLSTPPKEYRSKDIKALRKN